MNHIFDVGAIEREFFNFCAEIVAGWFSNRVFEEWNRNLDQLKRINEFRKSNQIKKIEPNDFDQIPLAEMAQVAIVRLLR